MVCRVIILLASIDMHVPIRDGPMPWRRGTKGQYQLMDGSPVPSVSRAASRTLEHSDL